MAITPYSHNNQNFSDRAHAAARSLVYPSLFGTASLDFYTPADNTLEKRILDGEQGIDRIIRVSRPGLSEALEFTVQERFRRSAFDKYKDITITEWNETSQLRGELFKLRAGLFVYGYFDPEADCFTEVICFNVPRLLRKIGAGSVKYQKNYNPRSGQSFISIGFDALHASGAVELHQTWPRNLAVDMPFAA